MKRKDSMNRLGMFGSLVVVFVLSGCSEQSGQKWDWFGLKKDDSDRSMAKGTDVPPPEPPPPTARTRRPSNPPPAQDREAQELDGKVARYVESVDRDRDPSYAGNDLNAKIDRQSDPDRQARIRQTAARTRGPEGQGQGAPAAARADGGGMTPMEIRPVAARDQGGYAAGAPSNRADPEPAPKPVRAEPSQSASTLQPGLYEDSAKPATASMEPGIVEAPPASPTYASAPSKPVASSDRMMDADAMTSETPPSSPQAPTETPARPPVLSEVKIAAADPREPPAKPISERITTNTTPITATPSGDSLGSQIAQQEKLVARDPNNLEEQFRLRLMYLINGQDDRALAPTSGINEDIQEIMQGHIHAVMTARSTSERDPATWANRQIDAIENLRSMVRAKADLRVPKVELCSAIDGFGRYEPIMPAQFSVGAKNLVLLYIEVDNFQCDQTSSGMYRTLLSVRQSLLDRSGQELWSKKDENIEDMARRRRSDFFLTIGPLAIPKTLGPGEYVMKVEVEDVLAGKMNGSSVKFKMVP